MKKIFFLLLLINTAVQAQYTIKGSMNPPDKNDWVILYKIEGAKQRFISNTHTQIDTIISNDKETQVANFEFTLPADAKTGVYRITYRQSAGGYVNFLFNKENVKFSFNPDFPEQTIEFSYSKENILFNEFLQANFLTQKAVDSLQIAYLNTPSKLIKKQYATALKKVTDIYKIYEGKSKGTLANHLIKAMQRDNIPEATNNTQNYFSYVVDNFFNTLDFNSKEVYNSSILVDRITDYIFYLNFSADPALQQKLFKEASATVMGKINTPKLTKEIIEYLLSQFVKIENAEIVDYLFTNYYDKLPINLQDASFKVETLGKLQAAISRTAPNFSWKEAGNPKNLATLNDGENYLLVFWSTSCSHCVKEIPKLYKYIQNQPNTKVIAYALEKEDLDWNEFIKQLYGWHHVISLNPNDKWDNKLVTETYQVHATPSYFILDKNKKIIAKPDNLEQIKKYYTNAQ